MAKESKIKGLINPKNLMKGAKPAIEFNAVTEELIREASDRLNYQEPQKIPIQEYFDKADYRD